ncbi:hypothetical protein BCEP4_2460008 [Burkholderia cepacia]|nr:hypothetical protein BCEP4_2460008 [Burkholderia cepacia]
MRTAAAKASRTGAAPRILGRAAERMNGRRFVLSQHLKRLDARRIQCPTVYASVTHALRHEGSRLGSLTG